MLALGDREVFDAGVDLLTKRISASARDLLGVKPGTAECMRILRQLGIQLTHIYFLGEVAMVFGIGQPANTEDTKAA